MRATRTSSGCWPRTVLDSSTADSITVAISTGAICSSTLWASSCAISVASPTRRSRRSVSSLMTVSNSLRCALVEIVIGEQAGDRSLDAGERRAQFVSDGIEQDGAQVFALMSGFGLRKFFHCSGALDGDADHAAQSLQRGAGEQLARRCQRRRWCAFPDAAE